MLCIRHSCCVHLQAYIHAAAVHNFTRTASIELGDIYRTASAISVFLDEADARPFINRLMSMPVMNADGAPNRSVMNAATINPNIEVCSCQSKVSSTMQCRRIFFFKPDLLDKLTWQIVHKSALPLLLCTVSTVSAVVR